MKYCEVLPCNSAYWNKHRQALPHYLQWQQLLCENCNIQSASSPLLSKLSWAVSALDLGGKTLEFHQYQVEASKEKLDAFHDWHTSR